MFGKSQKSFRFQVTRKSSRTGRYVERAGLHRSEGCAKLRCRNGAEPIHCRGGSATDQRGDSKAIPVHLAGSSRVLPLIIAAVAALSVTTSAFASSFASSVVNYDPGIGAAASYTSDPTVALGAPERDTGELAGFPGSVTMFSTPFGIDEIVSIGEGGKLTLEFDSPVTDDPANPFGVDMIMFGNTFFTTSDFTDGNITGSNAEGGTIEVSADGVNFVQLTTQADTLFPTQGYTDAGIFGTDENFLPNGTVPTDFFTPVDPSLSISDFVGLTYADALSLYNGSAGGTPVDLAGSGLASISFVRISVPVGAGFSTEIDAIVNVPEPATVALLFVSALSARRRRRN